MVIGEYTNTCPEWEEDVNLSRWEDLEGDPRIKVGSFVRLCYHRKLPTHKSNNFNADQRSHVGCIAEVLADHGSDRDSILHYIEIGHGADKFTSWWRRRDVVLQRVGAYGEWVDDIPKEDEDLGKHLDDVRNEMIAILAAMPKSALVEFSMHATRDADTPVDKRALFNRQDPSTLVSGLMERHDNYKNIKPDFDEWLDKNNMSCLNGERCTRGGDACLLREICSARPTVHLNEDQEWDASEILHCVCANPDDGWIFRDCTIYCDVDINEDMFPNLRITHCTLKPECMKPGHMPNVKTKIKLDPKPETGYYLSPPNRQDFPKFSTSQIQSVRPDFAQLEARLFAEVESKVRAEAEKKMITDNLNKGSTPAYAEVADKHAVEKAMASGRFPYGMSMGRRIPMSVKATPSIVDGAVEAVHRVQEAMKLNRDRLMEQTLEYYKQRVMASAMIDPSLLDYCNRHTHNVGMGDIEPPKSPYRDLSETKERGFPVWEGAPEVDMSAIMDPKPPRDNWNTKHTHGDAIGCFRDRSKRSVETDSCKTWQDFEGIRREGASTISVEERMVRLEKELEQYKEMTRPNVVGSPFSLSEWCQQPIASVEKRGGK